MKARVATCKCIILIETSMSLYSNNLCGLVLLTDDRVSTYSGIERELADLCQRLSLIHI